MERGNRTVKVVPLFSIREARGRIETGEKVKNYYIEYHI